MKWESDETQVDGATNDRRLFLKQAGGAAVGAVALAAGLAPRDAAADQGTSSVSLDNTGSISARPNYVFHLTSDGGLIGTYCKATSIGSETTVIVRSVKGGSATLTESVPGRLKTLSITLERPSVYQPSALQNWFQTILTGHLNTGFRAAALTLYDNTSGLSLASWQLTAAWPSSVEEFVDTTNGVLTERVVLEHSGILRIGH